MNSMGLILRLKGKNYANAALILFFAAQVFATQKNELTATLWFRGNPNENNEDGRLFVVALANPKNNPRLISDGTIPPNL